MKLRTGRVIEKWRYVVKVGKARFEVDVFKHRGLMIAEIELPTGAGSFRWLGKEVTAEKRYYNAALASSR